jgi:hypothetical protein
VVTAGQVLVVALLVLLPSVDTRGRDVTGFGRAVNASELMPFFGVEGLVVGFWVFGFWGIED